MTFFLSRRTTYSGSKPFSTSTPSLDLGRSMTCPTDAFTVNPDPRYFLIVRALAGDSTTTSDFPLTSRAFLPAVFLPAGFALAFAFGGGSLFLATVFLGKAFLPVGLLRAAVFFALLFLVAAAVLVFFLVVAMATPASAARPAASARRSVRVEGAPA